MLNNYGCVRLASLGLPRGPHSVEPLTIANRTITLTSRGVTACTSGHPQVTHSTSRALRADPGEPRQSYSNVQGQTGVDPGKLNERTLCVLCRVVLSFLAYSLIALIHMGRNVRP